MELIQVKSGDMTRAGTLEHVLCYRDNAVSFNLFSLFAMPHLKMSGCFLFQGLFQNLPGFVTHVKSPLSP